MNRREFPYRESLLQWIWQNLEFNCTGIQTASGKPIQIVDNGRLNPGAGPDFLHAHIIIDGLDLHGSVEIHNREKEWNSHRHQHDKNFNSVILHVVYSCNSGYGPALREDGTAIETLELSPHLTKPLQDLFKISHQKELPCGKNIEFINQRAFEHQINKAHKEYFDLKVSEILAHYNPETVPSTSWKLALIGGLYHSFGIPRNQENFKTLFRSAQLVSAEGRSGTEFVESVQNLAFSVKEIKNSIPWVTSGMRPANHPRKRVQQAAWLHYSILKIPFKEFIKNGVNSWHQVSDQIPKEFLAGKQLSSIQYHTVFLPAIYLLGDLFFSESLKKGALAEWNAPGQKIPAVIRKPFEKTGFSVNRQVQKYGLAHQLKRYCNQRGCHRCKIFKIAIRS